MTAQGESGGRPRKQTSVFDLAAHGENGGLWNWNLATGRIHFSPRWISMLGCEAQDVGNSPEEWFRRVHPDDSAQVQRDIAALLAGTPLRFENQHRLLHKDGTYRWMSCRGMVALDEKGQPARMAGSHSDITAEKVADALTGLPNRVLFLDRLTRSIERARRHHEFLYAVLLLNLDRFNSQIERLGSPAADQILIAAARRLETSLRGADTIARFGQDHVVARMGEDEFIILLDGLNEVGDAKFVAERLLKEISMAYEIGGQEVFLTGSVGIALSVTGYSRPEHALRDAETALHRAKSLGKARCEVFDTAILDSAQGRLGLEADLREALERRELSVVYEPIVSLASNQVAGFEALLRWKRSNGGMVAPLEFIPIAERTGLIVPLGKWILHEACRQLKEWQDNLGIPKDVFVSVNLASQQFKQPSLVEQIGEILSDTGIEPHCLMLELTESALMENPQAISSLLMRLRVVGVRIGIDDFGTGYSSLSYLRQFPVDVLKVDRSFVRRIEDSNDLVEIVRTIGGLARQLGLQVIAEGIENAKQLNVIRALDCEYGQGYFFSRPADAQNAGRLLTRGLPQRQETEAGREDGRAKAADSVRFRRGPSLPAVEGPSPDAFIMTQRKVRRTRRSRLVLVAGAALLVILAGGYAFYPAFYPDRTTSPASREQASAEADSPRVLTRVPASPPKKPLVYSFPVAHQHFLGSCKGILKISPDALSFIPEKGDDGFAFKFSEFSRAASDDELTIKSGSKTYRFESTAAGSKDEKRAELREITQRISTNLKDVPPKRP